MGDNFNCRSAQQQRHLAKHAQKVDANHFFNLLTDARMLEMVEAQLPEHRERQFPPTLTLAIQRQFDERPSEILGTNKHA